MSGPFLVTERLELWKPALRDHAGYVDLLAPEAVRAQLGARPTSVVEEFNRLLRNAGSWSLYGYGILACRLKGEDAIFGICGVFHSWRGFGKGMDDTPEVGWIFAERGWGKGLATEAARAAIAQFERDFGPRRIACMINDTNLASIGVAEKLGFVRYGEHEDEHDAARLVLMHRNG